MFLCPIFILKILFLKTKITISRNTFLIKTNNVLIFVSVFAKNKENKAKNNIDKFIVNGYWTCVLTSLNT